MAIEIMDFPINSMVIFHCYLSSPEGKFFSIEFVWTWGTYPEMEWFVKVYHRIPSKTSVYLMEYTTRSDTPISKIS